MKICINSRNLDPCEQASIESYFDRNFSFCGKRLTLIWKDEETDFILVGYEQGSRVSLQTHDVSSFMYRIHEYALLSLVGRDFHRLSDEARFS